MVRFAVTGAVAALIALTGCGGSQEREKKEQEAAAAEKKVAESRVFLEQLEREKKLLGTKLTEATARLTESRGMLHRTLAGAAYLAAEQDNGGLVIDVDMASARDGFLLEEAARARDHEAVSELATRALDDQRPCVRIPGQQAEADEDACPPCQVDPYEDACVGVATHSASTPEWSCATLARTGEGLPPTAFCTSELRHPAPEGSVKSPYAERNLFTELHVARVAFAHNGQLHVSDYPGTDRFLYNPPAVETRVLCERNTERNKCIYECEVSHGRYEDPCACEQPSPEPAQEEEESYGDGPSDAEGEEDPEVRRAREAAAEAEAEAEAARERVAEAQRELRYQECLTACDATYEPDLDESSNSDMNEGAPPPPQPTSSRVNVRLEATPAPGIFVVSRELQLLGDERQVLESSSLTVVLRHPALVALWRKKPLPREELGSLEEVGALDTVTTEGGKASLVSLPGVEGTALVGLLEGSVKGYAFNTQPGQEPVVTLEPAVVCEAVRAEPKRFPQRFQDACAKFTAAARPEADAGASEGPTDAGTPESPVDAGPPASPVDAGQGVAP